MLSSFHSNVECLFFILFCFVYFNSWNVTWRKHQSANIYRTVKLMNSRKLNGILLHWIHVLILNTNSRDWTSVVLFFRQFPTNVKFHLLFNTPIGSYVTENITHVLKDMAPHRLKDGFELVDIGDLNLIWNRYHIDMKATNYTMHTATDIAHTGTIDFPSTQGPGKIMYCKKSSKSIMQYIPVFVHVTYTNSFWDIQCMHMYFLMFKVFIFK